MYALVERYSWLAVTRDRMCWWWRICLFHESGRDRVLQNTGQY